MDTLSYLLGKKAGGGGGGSTLQVKSVSITENGSTTINPDANYDGMSAVNLTTNVQPDLESKSVEITNNGETVIEPDENYDGLSKVNLTTNVKLKYPPKVIGTIINSATVENINYYLNQITFTQLNDWKSFFESLNIVGTNKELDLTPMYSSQQIVSCAYAFVITGIDKLILPSSRGNITLRANTNAMGDINCYGMFNNCSAKEIVGLSRLILSHTSQPRAQTPYGAVFISAFEGCSKLKKIDIPQIRISYPTKEGLANMFKNCNKAELIDIRGIALNVLTGTPSAFVSNVPTTCTFIVKDANSKTWFSTNYSSYTNVYYATEWTGSYHIHYNLDTGSLTGVPYYQIATASSTATLYDSTVITPPTGKVFVKWVDENGDDLGTTIDTGTAGQTLEAYAVFEDE